MDLHKFEAITVEECRLAHIADLAVQEKYGVKYIMYYVNEEAGLVFCLVDAPDKEAAAAVHNEAHGNVACNIIEVVKGGEYEFFMGHELVGDPPFKNRPSSSLWTEKAQEVRFENGAIDTGYRVILYADITAHTCLEDKSERIITEALKKFHGKKLIDKAGGIMAVFTSGSSAVRCAEEIQSNVRRLCDLPENKNYIDIELQIGLSAGGPVTDTDNHFAPVMQQAKRLCHVAADQEILASSGIQDMLGKRSKKDFKGKISLKTVNYADEKFLNKLLEIIEARLGEDGFNVANFARAIGMSRPQLYRKTIALTRRSPNDFIREMRLKKAAKLLKRKYHNISQVALEVGFNNPSYFSKCFYDRFGQNPSTFIKQIS